jgi:hypothetical protein
MLSRLLDAMTDKALAAEAALAQAGTPGSPRLDRLISHLESAMAGAGPARALELGCQLQQALIIRYQRAGAPGDLRRSLELARRLHPPV